MRFFKHSSFFRKTQVVFACACVSVSVCATSEAYSPPAFEHYQPILDRMPFGALPSAFNDVPVDPNLLKNDAQAKAEQQILAKKINMSAVNVTPDGQTAIGFTDLSQVPPVNYYLLVGTVAGGWTVKDADFDAETATIEKEGVTITLKLGQGLVDAPAGSVAKRPGLAPFAQPTRMPLPGGITGLRMSSGGYKPSTTLPAVVKESSGEGTDTRSYAERARERKNQQTAALLATETKQREQLEVLAREAAANEMRRREDKLAQAEEEAKAQAQAQQAPEADAQMPAAEPPAAQ